MNAPADTDIIPPYGSPLGTEEEFAADVADFVSGQAPTTFALVLEHGERADAQVIGWGLAFDDHVDVITLSGSLHKGFSTVTEARRRFALGERKVRVVSV